MFPKHSRFYRKGYRGTWVNQDYSKMRVWMYLRWLCCRQILQFLFRIKNSGIIIPIAVSSIVMVKRSVWESAAIYVKTSVDNYVLIQADRPINSKIGLNLQCCYLACTQTGGNHCCRIDQVGDSPGRWPLNYPKAGKLGFITIVALLSSVRPLVLVKSPLVDLVLML